ncbi:MAG TPA: hypothetical protein VM328_02405 [Fimbriimonadaceae bacterium]|nr:hypothetical protein [Fimbriimonadaceae bacterium]
MELRLVRVLVVGALFLAFLMEGLAGHCHDLPTSCSVCTAPPSTARVDRSARLAASLQHRVQCGCRRIVEMPCSAPKVTPPQPIEPAGPIDYLDLTLQVRLKTRAPPRAPPVPT